MYSGKVYSGNVSISQPHGVNALCFELLYGSELLHSLIGCGIVKEGTLDDKAVKILLDTGSQTSAARADLVAREKWDLKTQIPVKCVDGDLTRYLSAEVEIGVDGVLKPVRVALIPEMPLDLLLGANDFMHTHSEATPVISGNQNLMVLTSLWTQERCKEVSYTVLKSSCW